MAEIKKIIIDGVKVEGEPLENGRIAKSDEGDMLWGKNGVAEQVGEVRYDEDGGLSLEGDNIEPYPDYWGIDPNAAPIKRPGNGLRHDISVGHKAYIKELGHKRKNLIRSFGNDISAENYDEQTTEIGNGTTVKLRSGGRPQFDVGSLGEYGVRIPIEGIGEGLEIADEDLYNTWFAIHNTNGYYRIVVTRIGYGNDIRIDYAGDPDEGYDGGILHFSGLNPYEWINRHYYKTNLEDEWVYDAANTIKAAYTKAEAIVLCKFKKDETTAERAAVWNILKDTYVEFKTVTIGEYIDGEWSELSRGSTTLRGSIPEGLDGFYSTALKMTITPERTDGASMMVKHEEAAYTSDIEKAKVELNENIAALISDEETLSDKTWSSEKIDAFVEVLRTAMNNKFTLIDNKSVLIDNKLVAVDESLAALLSKTNAIINDAVAASISTYSSVKINNLLTALSQSVEAARKLAEGARVGIVFDDTNQLDRWLAGTYVRDDGALSGSLKVGESIYIIALNEPDYFWDGTQYHEQETKTVLSGYYTSEQVDALLEDINNLLGDKVDKEAGKALSTNDYTTAEQTKLAGIEAGAQVNAVTGVAGKAGDVTLESSDVGLGNVDNTSDLDKPVSTATQAALDLKADINTNIQQVAITSSTSGEYATVDFGKIQVLIWKEATANVWSLRVKNVDTVAHTLSYNNLRLINSTTASSTSAVAAAIASNATITLDTAVGNGAVGNNRTSVVDTTDKVVYDIRAFTQATTAVLIVERIPY